ncbi:recombinase family protein, partial [Winogradskyella poriferorum]|uniref:recombinase family protein n=1 Tax=Winogradskyella poriferorum TaxID=307627 RepID=UPI003D659937
SKGVAFCSIQEGFDTSTPVGKLFFHVCGAFAEFERNLNRERTSAGRKAARARGRKGGRKHVLTPQQAKRIALKVESDENVQITDI